MTFIGVVLLWAERSGGACCLPTTIGVRWWCGAILQSFPTPVWAGSGSKGLSQPRRAGAIPPLQAGI